MREEETEMMVEEEEDFGSIHIRIRSHLFTSSSHRQIPSMTDLWNPDSRSAEVECYWIF
jgi:hypothetical protein